MKGFYGNTYLISDSDSECDSISHDSPPLSDTEISNGIGTPSKGTETPIASTNCTGTPTTAISDSTGTPGTTTPTMPESLVDSQTPGSSNTSQLAGHTPVLPKVANSKHNEDNCEVTLDTVHKNLSKMIGSVLERMDNTEKRINSLEQKIVSMPESKKKNQNQYIIDKAVRVSV